MCIALELAPMGSLFGILDKKLEAIKAAQADLPTSNIKMPGGVLGHEISARIALQVSKRERESIGVGMGGGGAGAPPKLQNYPKMKPKLHHFLSTPSLAPPLPESSSYAIGEYHYLCSAHYVLMRMLLRAFVSYTSTSSVLMYAAGSSYILCIVFSNRLALYN